MSFSRFFQQYITCTQIPNILVGKPKLQVCSYLVIAEHTGQKNHNGGTTTAVLFLHSSMLVYGKSQLFLLVVNAKGSYSF